MKTLKKFYLNPLSISITLILTLSGCRHSLNAGHYEGNLLKRVDNQTQTEPIKVEIQKIDSKTFDIRVNNLNDDPITYARIQRSSVKHQLTITSDLFSQSTVEIKKIVAPQLDGLAESSQRCYALYTEKSVEFCFEKDRFLFQIRDSTQEVIYEISANLFSTESEIAFEEPVTLKLSSAIERAFRQNFDSRIAYEQRTRAHYSVQSAFANLFPHLTSNLIWNTTPDYVSAIATLQAIVPFLLPTYWIDAKISEIDEDVADLSLTTMRANLATNVEEMTYGLHRDFNTLKAHQKAIQLTLKWRDQILKPENQSPLAPQAKKTLDSLMSDLKSDSQGLENLIQQSRIALAETLGYRNPEAIQTIEVDSDELLSSEPSPVDPLATAKLASERALEVKEIDLSKRKTWFGKLANLFFWIDPSSDAKQSLGANTYFQQKEGRSRIEENRMRREQTRLTIHKNVYKLSLAYNLVITSVNETGRIRHEAAKNIVAASSSPSIDAVETFSIKIHEYLKALIIHEAALAQFRIFRARMDRNLLRGNFIRLQPRIERGSETFKTQL